MHDNPAMADERGHLKVFIGMAPGRGQDLPHAPGGRAEAQNGRDVAIGYLEPHGRAETLAQAEGLEVIAAPPRRLPRQVVRGDGPAGECSRARPSCA